MYSVQSPGNGEDILSPAHHSSTSDGAAIDDDPFVENQRSHAGSTSQAPPPQVRGRLSSSLEARHPPRAEKRPTFDKLKSIEKERRAILLRVELPYWRVILFWTGTCLRDISTDTLVWGTMLIYIAFRIYAHQIEDSPEPASLLDKTNINVIGGFLSFFLVLFVNQTQSRFLEMYNFSKGCFGRIQDVAGLAKTQLPHDLALELVRHINASHIAGYVGMNSVGSGCPYSKTHFFGHYNEKHNLLTPDEMKLIDRHNMDEGPDVFKELVTWCQLDVNAARKAGLIDSYQEKLMHERILEFRTTMDKMYDYTDQPPHFFYVHFLVLLSTLYLPLFAIDTANNAGWGEDTYIGWDILNGIIVLLQCIFVVGLRLLGIKMIDPYGDDFEDLSIITYVEGALGVCRVIMTSNRASPNKRN